MKIKLLTCILVALFSLNAFGQSTPKTVDQVIVLSGIKDQLSRLDGMITTKIEEKKSTFSKPEQFEQFKTIMTTGLNSKNAVKYFSEYLEKYSKEDSMKLVVTFFDNPFMQEFNRLEKEAASSEKQKEVAAYFQSLKVIPPAQGRVQQLVTLNQEMKSSELTLKLVRNLILSMIKGANYNQPKDKQISDEEIKSNLTSIFTADYEQQMTNQIIAYALFTYKDVPDEKLNQYIEVWKTSTGKYSLDQLLNALDYSFTKMSEITGSTFSVLEKSK
ncbi:MAG: hypothetical protein Q8880_12855 [Bacteroidota bacterium]|nr:hypothetical protein [Bacteroidota bacterium]